MAYQKWERPPDAIFTSVSKTVNFLDHMIHNMEAIQGQNYVKRKPKYLHHRVHPAKTVRSQNTTPTNKSKRLTNRQSKMVTFEASY